MDIEDRMDRMEKDNDGVKLALGANVEALENMNAALAQIIRKQEEDEEKVAEARKVEEEDEKEEKMVKDLIKALEYTYPHIFKQEEVAGKGPDSDESKAALPKPKEDQEPIDDGKVVAKQDEDKEEEKDEEKEVEKQDEEPKEAEEKDEAKEEIEKLRKELKDVKKSVDREVADRLRKAGFKEVGGLNQPASTDLGTTEMPIVKGDETERELVEKLSKKSYKEIRKIQEQAEGPIGVALPGAWNFD